ncbi:putative isomerase YbhE [Macrolepiota fuliginosa MF-IS2]|uniref:Isomerase YbhE n=1 Tax=Macrolepiota fuliginosa MF-IS2 TaxID=1400762 RepID=A0A9P5XED8_9AGAR|nr:putative isomerase YbhE [Macrolepiota fuliginosa MF-IS2]
MVSFKILAGGYDVFIATYLFNPQTSSLSVASRSPTGLNVSWITQHPTNPIILYAVNENTPGALQSFIINSNGTLSAPQDTIPSDGNLPAFTVALSTGEVAVMNYDSGNGLVIPTVDSALRFNNDTPLITFPKPPDTVSHPHMVLEHGEEILVPDKGQDKIWRLARDTTNPALFAIQGIIPQPAGSGPRHIAIHEDRLFTLHELSSTLTVQVMPAAPNGTSPILSDVSIIPPNPPQGAVFAAAEILIPEPNERFPVPYIYVSNRNIGVQTSPKGDSVAIFELVNKGTKNEELQLVNQVFTGLDQIRGMEFGPADKGLDEFLIAAGVAGDAGTVMLKRTEGGRNMEIVARNLDIPTRSTFIWL